MLRRWIILSLALFCLCASALAEVYTGVTVAQSTVTVSAERDGVVESVPVQAGQRVDASEALVQMQSEKTFATQDGTVSLVNAREGDDVSGDVLEITPVERYTIHCTVDKAYQSAESTLVHSGETLYVKCTADGSHRAIGLVTQIDGETYQVLTIGGELYVGETVYLYRDDAFTTSQRVGIGTVVVSDTETYRAEGKLTLLRVAEGDFVERGQLLFETGGGTLSAEAGGIISTISVQPGDSVRDGQTVLEIAPADAICVEIQVEEDAVARLSVGDSAWLVYPGQDDEDAEKGVIVEVFAIAESEAYTVRIRPESGEAPALGMSVEVHI